MDCDRAFTNSGTTWECSPITASFNALVESSYSAKYVSTFIHSHFAVYADFGGKILAEVDS